MSRWLLDLSRQRRMVLGVCQQELAWAVRDATGLARSVQRAWSDSAPTALRDALARGPDAPPIRQADIIASNSLALHWLQTPPSNLASFDELRLVAQARCAHLHGGTPADWWVTGNWRASAPFVCAALPMETVQSVEKALAALGAQAQWHTAWGLLCSANAAAFPADGWSALRTPAQVMLWHCHSGRVDSLSTLAVDVPEDGAVAAARALQHMRIEASRAPGLAIGTLHWLDLAAHRGGPAPAGTQVLHLGASVQSDGAALSEATAALLLGKLLRGGAA